MKNWTLFPLLFLVACGPWVASLQPIVEGQLFPVVSAGRIDAGSVQETKAGGAAFSMSALKRRNCVWQRTEWFLGSRDGLKTPGITRYAGPPEFTTPGELTWDGVKVNLTPDQLLNNSLADVVHYCYTFGVPRLVRSKLYN